MKAQILLLLWRVKPENWRGRERKREEERGVERSTEILPNQRQPEKERGRERKTEEERARVHSSVRELGVASSPTTKFEMPKLVNPKSQKSKLWEGRSQSIQTGRAAKVFVVRWYTHRVGACLHATTLDS